MSRRGSIHLSIGMRPLPPTMKSIRVWAPCWPANTEWVGTTGALATPTLVAPPRAIFSTERSFLQTTIAGLFWYIEGYQINNLSACYRTRDDSNCQDRRSYVCEKPKRKSNLFIKDPYFYAWQFTVSALRKFGWTVDSSRKMKMNQVMAQDMISIGHWTYRSNRPLKHNW